VTAFRARRSTLLFAQLILTGVLTVIVVRDMRLLQQSYTAPTTGGAAQPGSHTGSHQHKPLCIGCQSNQSFTRWPVYSAIANDVRYRIHALNIGGMDWTDKDIEWINRTARGIFDSSVMDDAEARALIRVEALDAVGRQFARARSLDLDTVSERYHQFESILIDGMLDSSSLVRQNAALIAVEHGIATDPVAHPVLMDLVLEIVSEASQETLGPILRDSLGISPGSTLINDASR